MARGHRELKPSRDTLVRAGELSRLLKLRQVEPKEAVMALAVATAGALREWDKDRRGDILINFEEIVLDHLAEDKEPTV